MEEQALYRAILAAPHDDAPRLVYADWLDENADAFPAPVARAERARAEFIRLQCKLARTGPAGWTRYNPPDRDLMKRQQRLLFRHGRAWRRGFPIAIASSSFDRGFFRPSRALRPQEFLGQVPIPGGLAWQLAADSLAHRCVPDEPLAACPLWDVHLYASTWQSDPRADRGQYGELLAEVGRSPALHRVGWLKVSFFGTPVYDFLRTGNFANVETLVLNAGPFPEVLDGVAANESFRSLRYVILGENRWSWAPADHLMVRANQIADKLVEANNRHLPYGEMRAALRAIIDGTPLVPPAPPPPVAPQPLIGWTPAIGAGSAPRERSALPLLLLGLVVGGSFLASLRDTVPARPATPVVRPSEVFQFKPPPDYRKQTEEMIRLLDKLKEPPSHRFDGPAGSRPPAPEMIPWERPSEAPEPRPVERKDSPDEE